jgi:Phage integrase family
MDTIEPSSTTISEPRGMRPTRMSASSRVVLAATATPALRSSLVAFWDVAVPNTPGRSGPAQARAVTARTRILPVPAGRVITSAVRPEASTCQAAAAWSSRSPRCVTCLRASCARSVPCPPPLTKLLQEHLAELGGEPAEPLFRGLHGRPLATITYRRAWNRARQAALSDEEYRSPLARRPYDLRHACLSTWLNGGVPPTQVAEWAGHSVEILLRVYAKCLEGQHEIAKRRIAATLADVE